MDIGRVSYVRIALGGILAVLFSSATAQADNRPNVVFIMSDDHAYQAIGAYGSVWNQTPNIDRIANQGIRFDRCYVADSICAPSRAAILTGKHSHLHGVRDNYTEFDGEQWTFPKALQRAGYQTAMIGKWHLKSDPTGFDHWDILPGQGKYYRPKFRTASGEREVPGYVTDITTKLATDWLSGESAPGNPGASARKPDQPFLLMMHHKAPHRPWAPAPRHLKAFIDKELPEPATLFDDYATRTSAPIDAEMRISQMRLGMDLKVWQAGNKHRDWLYNHMDDAERQAWESQVDPRFKKFHEAELTGKPLTRWLWRQYLEDYLGCIAAVDESVGKVLDCLEEAGLAENTVVIYTSDQGFYLGEHGWFDKRFMYEQSLRTPLLIRWPTGISRDAIANGKPRTEDRIVSNIDFAATFVELANTKMDEKSNGRSLVPVLKGTATPKWRSDFYYHYHEGPDRDHAVARHDGVTDGSTKLIHFYELDEWELYDLSKDPYELKNCYADPAYSEHRDRMTSALLNRRKKLGVPLP